MTIALLSGRQDWLPRIPYFAFLGAVGFGFGGAMSYMKDIAYIIPSDSATVLYGFGCVFLLGALWAAPAAAGLGLAAWLDRDQLTKFCLPLAVIFLAWHFLEIRGIYRAVPWLRVLGDTALSGTLAILVVGILVLIRRSNWGDAALLIVCMAVGSWIGHLVLIQLLHIELNPPRGGTWAGNVGMVGGILFYCWRRHAGPVAFATLGGFFSEASALPPEEQPSCWSCGAATTPTGTASWSRARAFSSASPWPSRWGCWPCVCRRSRTSLPCAAGPRCSAWSSSSGCSPI